MIVKNEIRGGELGLVRFRLAVGVGLVRFRHLVGLGLGIKLNIFILFNSPCQYKHKAFLPRERSFFEGILVLKRERVYIDRSVEGWERRSFSSVLEVENSTPSEKGTGARPPISSTPQFERFRALAQCKSSQC